MAIFKDGKFGKLSGKIGPVIIYERNGKQVVRANTKPRDPKTPSQLAHRMKFSLANKGMSPLNSVIKVSYRNSKKNFRKLVGEAYHNAIKGEYPDFEFDYSRVKVAEGNVQLPANITLKIDKESSQAAFTWDTRIIASSRQGKDNDQVNIVCLNASISVAEQSLNAARRSQGKASFNIPDGWKQEDLHFWVYLATSDLEENSDSFYVK